MGKICNTIGKRLIKLPDLSRQSIFLWGPRRVGKSYFLRNTFPEEPYLDLLQTDVFLEYVTRPALLRERYSSPECYIPNNFIIIDEIQKVPALLDEVHWLIENKKIQFILTGSSARKLKRGHANLLAGRAWRREMHPLSLQELANYDLEKLMLSGLLPPHVLSIDPTEDLRAYVNDYLKEEIAAEGLVQNLPAFNEFLRVAALTSSELINYSNIAREVGVSAKVVRGYFQILEDTFLGYRIAPWVKSKNRRLIETEKFYLFDVGVTNYLSRRAPKFKTPEFGKSFEQLILMELSAFKAYRNPDMEISFWRTSTGQEVDFIINDKELALEVKSSTQVNATDLKGLTALAEDGAVKKRIIVSCDSQPRQIQDKFGKVEILPWLMFIEKLWAGDLL